MKILGKNFVLSSLNWLYNITKVTQILMNVIVNSTRYKGQNEEI